MNIDVGFIEVPGGKVWYRIAGGNSSSTPLLVLHGGPGSVHDPLTALDAITADRPVIYYDQLGSGNSDRPSEPELWNLNRFIEELDCVITFLGFPQVHLLGHSWGTMLAAAYLLERKPAAVQSVIFSSPCLSAKLWKSDADRLLKELPAEITNTLAHCEEHGTTESEEYKKAMKAYYQEFVCRISPWPAVLKKSSEGSNNEVYTSMWGSSEFSPTGTLKHFDVTTKLHEISIPALFTCGRYDEATPESTAYYHTLVEGSQFHVFEKSAHMPYLEENEEYLRAVKEFLKYVEK
ncbi:proline iminopeptidase-family hydrolase [Peribacillus sp. B-H-3]|uniref:proline iminopeptidase-family hydrolase n=1 Tax=Peribacillus sp. B-H-3 TaxID=3400420 RepID=UPI003B015923